MTWYPELPILDEWRELYAGSPGTTAASRTAGAACSPGPGGGLHRHHLLVFQLDLRHRGRSLLVGRPVGRPHGQVDVRGHRDGGRPRDGRVPGADRRRLAHLGRRRRRLVPRSPRRNPLPRELARPRGPRRRRMWPPIAAAATTIRTLCGPHGRERSPRTLWPWVPQGQNILALWHPGAALLALWPPGPEIISPAPPKASYLLAPWHPGPGTNWPWVPQERKAARIGGRTKGASAAFGTRGARQRGRRRLTVGPWADTRTLSAVASTTRPDSGPRPPARSTGTPSRSGSLTTATRPFTAGTRAARSTPATTPLTGTWTAVTATSPP